MTLIAEVLPKQLHGFGSFTHPRKPFGLQAPDVLSNGLAIYIFEPCKVTLAISPIVVEGASALGDSPVFNGFDWCINNRADRFYVSAIGLDSGQYFSNVAHLSLRPKVLAAGITMD